MKQYTVLVDFWHKGLLQQAGSVIRMADAEAKYLAHALQDNAAKVEAAITNEVKAIETKVLGAVASEAPANGTSN